MLRGGVFGHCGLRWGTLGLTTFIAVAALTTNADARRGHRQRSSDAGESYQPSYASIVVDANSGAVMQSTNADSPRHPASLTKIMTLYLLFERLEQSKIKLTSELPVSAHAAVQAPSKLGLKLGETIRVETAIRAMVEKIITERVSDGQLDDCDLTLRDVQRVKDAFCELLAGVYHERIPYPEDRIARITPLKPPAASG